MQETRKASLFLLLLVCTSLHAANPPDLLNYQGVLRDASDNPLDGDYDMTFAFYDAETAGNEILVDKHVTAGPGPVKVDAGLFNVQLGGGLVSDGAGPGTYGELTEIFRDHAAVWLEIQVAAEVLSPRVRVLSSAYAMNATHLAGRPAGEFLDTSATTQTKSGALVVDTATSTAVEGHGSVAGAHFTATGRSADAYVGYGHIGIQATGGQAGGYFNTVGIGTANPSVPLDVVGDANITGNITAALVESGSGGFRFPDGSVQTTAGTWPPDNHRVVLDTGGVGLSSTSVVVGTDGLPVVSYYDQTNTYLKVAHCLDTSCLSKTAGFVDGPSVGQDSSIAIGSDGFPVISYYDAGNQDLKIAHCLDLDCIASTVQTVDSVGAVGTETSIAIGNDGFPVISYRDESNQDLKVAHCLDVGCSSSTTTTVDNAGNVGRYTAIAIGTDGFPVISYYDDSPNRDLKVAHCLDPGCSSSTTTTVDGGAGITGQYTSIAIGSDGFPVISYYAGSPDNHLRVAHCLDVACSGSETRNVDNNGQYTSIAIGPDGYPVVSYRDSLAADLKVADCQSFDCGGAPGVAVDVAGNVGVGSSIAIGSDGRPVVSYYDSDRQSLRIVTHVQVGGGSAASDSVADGGERATVGDAAPGQRGRLPHERPAASLPSTGFLARLPIDAEGNVYARSFRPGAADLASLVPVAEPVEPGDVLVIDPATPGLMSLAGQAADAAVFGVVAGEPGVVLGAETPKPADLEGDPTEAPSTAAPAYEVPVALSGVVSCKVDAGYGPIRPGDLLTTSPTPGHAMLAHEPLPGTILGKALEPLDSGTGLIRILVTLR
jgi:predicted regulator of Ras-like GTPase activity (Roadblock/LC7/MglB family)